MMNSQLLSRLSIGLLSLAVSAPVLAAGPAMEATQKQSLNLHAIAMFFVFVLMTLGDDRAVRATWVGGVETASLQDDRRS